jgi:signal transduction histidine kinase
LLLLVAIAFLAGILPAGVVLERWLARGLERRAAQDLATAPSVVAARDAALHDAMMMHAKELAHETALAVALRARDRTRALAVVEPTARSYNYGGVLVGSEGDVWFGPAGSASLADATRTGAMPVRVVADDAGLHLVSLAPVFAGREWLGAVGVTIPLDAAAAGALTGLTHSDHVLLISDAGQLTAASGDSVPGREITRAWERAEFADNVRELRINNTRYLVSAASLGGATALFVHDLSRELAMLQVLRRIVLVTGAGALAVALLLGYLLAGRLARPVRELAAAAERLSVGDFAAPLPASAIREVARVTAAFAEMRSALAGRLDELRAANRLLEERQARLSALQSELIKRERVATSARMAAELAHEIRNPVANIRNCLELLQRRLGHDAEAREFAVMAIDELLRMHELAERLLHLNRPREPEVGSSDAVAVARDVITLTELGNAGAPIVFSLEPEYAVEVAMPADALKQVLLNLVQNARDAKPNGLVVDIRIRPTVDNVCITVCDNGPGIPPRLRERIFDPFFTTRARAGGVGLGLFLVEGMVRGHGGTVSLQNRHDATGACFDLTLPAAQVPPRRAAQPHTQLTIPAGS